MSSSPSFAPDEKTNARRKIILTIALVLAVMLSVLASLYRVNNGVDAQNKAVRAMFIIVGRYAESHEGKWPTSWKDLEALPSTGEWPDPIDYDLVRQHVIIDFDVTGAELSDQSPAEFNAIRAINPVFDFAKDPRLTELLNTLARSNDKKK